MLPLWVHFLSGQSISLKEFSSEPFWKVIRPYYLLGARKECHLRSQTEQLLTSFSALSFPSLHLLQHTLPCLCLHQWHTCLLPGWGGKFLPCVNLGKDLTLCVCVRACRCSICAQLHVKPEANLWYHSLGAIHLVFGGRVPHWPGTGQVG